MKIHGGLGNPRGARFKTYERLSAYMESLKGTLFETGGQAARERVE